MENYKTQSYKYLVAVFALAIPLVLILAFFSWIQVYIALGYGNGDLFVIIYMLVLELILLRVIYPMVITFGSCLFNITFYKDKFEFKTLFRNKTFYYTEVASLIEILPLTGHMQNREAKIRIIEIKLKNKKTMHILINALNKERQGELRQDLQKYMKFPLELRNKFILTIK